MTLAGVTGVPTPAQIGLTSYSQWRHGQDAAFKFLRESGGDWSVCALPTGVGKSLLAIAGAITAGVPTVILTSTKALQEQYSKDFGAYGLVSLKGMSNYPCDELRRSGFPAGTCEMGPCLDGKACSLKSGGCAYYDQVEKAKRSPLVVTNYAWWFTAARSPNPPIGERPLVICDEAHSAVEELSRFVGVEFANNEVDLGDKVGWTIPEWQEWAKEQRPKIAAAIPKAKSMYALKTLRQMEQKVLRLIGITPSGWCKDMFESKSVRMEPVWARQYVNSYLRQQARKVVLLSATIRPYHLDWFGVSDYDFFEVESPFPVKRRPVYWLPTVRMSRATEESGFPRLMKRIDDLIESRADRKGIVHTVSYSRAKQIVQNSRFADRMLINENTNTSKLVEEFKRAPKPWVLVSPSVDTGFDFPYSAAEYQIIAKVPFPVPTDPLVAARSLEDDTYHAKVAVSRLVQMTGRVMRAEDDCGETFIIDDNVNFLQSRYKPFFPRWWREAYVRVGFVPPPPPSLLAGGQS